MAIKRITPGTSGLAQNLSARKNILRKKLNVLKKVQSAVCAQNEY